MARKKEKKIFLTGGKVGCQTALLATTLHMYMASLNAMPSFFFNPMLRRPTPLSLFDLKVLGSTAHKVHGFFFVIPRRVLRRLSQCSTSKFLVQRLIKYMALQRHKYYLTLNYAGFGSARGISPIRRDPMGAGYHRAFLSAMGQAKLNSGYLHSPRCLTAP